MTCPCGAELNPDTATAECAECAWYRLGGTERVDEVDERQGLLNAINILCAPPRRPTVTLTHADTGKYLVGFGYDPEVVALLKAAVPSQMRKWYPTAKCWEVSTEWAGPLLAALRNASVPVTGLAASEEARLFGWCAPPGRDADRAVRAYRVCRVLAAKSLAPWPQAVPSKGDAYVCRVPVLVDTDDVAIPQVPDYTEAADAVLSQFCAPGCPICGRKPANGAAAHTGCRHRFLALLDEKPFSKPRNAAFQVGQCTVCAARPHEPGSITCEVCAALRQRVEAQ